MGDVGSPALVSVSCSTSYYYPCDCATMLTRRDPKQTHTHTLSHANTHSVRVLPSLTQAQAIPKSYFFWTLWELLNLALAGSAGIIIKTLVTRLPVLGGLATPEGNSHRVDVSRFTHQHMWDRGLFQSPDCTCASWYRWHLWNAQEHGVMFNVCVCVCTTLR